MYSDLSKMVAELREFYLPADYMSTNRIMSPQELDYTASFVIRCHGEIEDAIENECRRIARDAKTEFDSGRWTHSAASLVMYCGTQAQVRSKLVDCFETKEDERRVKDGIGPGQILEAALKKYEDVVSNNNGVKASNILSMLMPLGVPCEFLDRIGLLDLDDLGDLRGILVHRTSSRWQRDLGHPTVCDAKVTKALRTIRMLAIGLRRLPG